MASTEAFPTRIAHYRILRPLGAGGMARVFLAEDEKLQRQLALKLLPRAGTDAIATEARFLREARAAARLDHPNVCAIFEVGEAPEGSFIAMQFIEGETLAARMGRRKLELGEALDIAIQVLDALAEAHAKGIVHRDIKPANIMLTPKNQVKVLDFGLATSIFPGSDPTLMGLTQSGMIVGTVPYMSPEQLKANPLDGRSDLFSVGTLLYEMATGHRPFLANSGAEVMSSILTQVPPLLENDGEAAAGVLPPALCRILRHALEKDPARRFSTAAEFRGELEVLRMGLAVSGGFTRAQPQSMNSDPLKFLRRSGARLRQHQGLRWSLATLAVALVLGGAWWGWRGAGGPPRQALDSIAVLPFSAPSGDAEADLMAEGLTDEVIRELARRPNLKVIARSSVLRYKGPQPDLRAAGRELGVKAVLVGAFRRQGSRPALSVELVDPRDLRQLWSNTYQGSVADLPALQERLLRDLGRRATWELPAGTAKTAPRRINGEAFELYLRGKRALEKMTLEDTKRGFGFLEEALRLDPGFALARAEMAQGYLNLSAQYLPSSEALPKMQAEAEKALELDPELPEAYTALAYAKAVSTHDLGTAESLYYKATELAPGSARVHENYGYFLTALGRHTDAHRELDRAASLDPLSATVYCVKGKVSVSERDWDQVERIVKKIQELEPENVYAVMLLMRADLGRDRALEVLKRAEAFPEPRPSTLVALYGIALGRLGRNREALRVADSLLRPFSSGKTRAPSHYHASMVFASTRDKVKAIQHLTLAGKAKEEPILFIGVDPAFDEYRNDPEFLQLRKNLLKW